MSDGITIMISVWQAQEFIADCLESIKAQTVTDWELLLAVDGCEQTLEAIRAMPKDDRIRLFWSPQNVGNYTLYNSMLPHATNSYTVIFGADDTMCPWFLDYDLHMRDKYDVVGHCYHVLHHGTQTIRIPKQLLPASGVVGVWKDVYKATGGFMPWRCAADTEFRERVARNKYLFGYKSELTFYRRSHPGSVTKAEATGPQSDLRNGYKAEIAMMSAAMTMKIETKTATLEEMP